MAGDGPILVVHPGALGDLVANFASLRRLKARFPEGVDGVCQGHLGSLAAGLGVFGRTFPVEAAAFAPLYADDAGPPDPAMAARFRPYRRVILFSSALCLQRGVRRVFSGPVHPIPPRPPPDRRIHIHDHVTDHLVAAGLLAAADFRPAPDPSPFIGSADPRGDLANSVLIHPGSGSPRKNWPLERFMALARRIRAAGMAAEFILGPAEPHLRAGIREGGREWTIHAPAGLASLTQVLSRGRAYVGNDAGATHLAAYLGLPTLAIFGPSDPLRWAPRGRSVAVLTPPGPECDPCFERSDLNCDGAPCLASVTVDAAAVRLFRLLAAG